MADTTTTTTTRKLLSLPPPRPKSPPEYPDLCGKRRELVKVQMLERETSFIQDELKYVEGLQPASLPCKEVTDFVLANSDPFMPTTARAHKSCRFWRWLCGWQCLNLSWIWCCCCTPRFELPKCCSCTNICGSCGSLCGSLYGSCGSCCSKPKSCCCDKKIQDSNCCKMHVPVCCSNCWYPECVLPSCSNCLCKGCASCPNCVNLCSCCCARYSCFNCNICC